MITVNMHEAKTRLSELVKAIEEKNEKVIICRDGKPVAEVHRAKPLRRNRLKPNPALRVELAPGFDPVEPLREDEIPPEYR